MATSKTAMDPTQEQDWLASNKDTSSHHLHNHHLVGGSFQGQGFCLEDNNSPSYLGLEEMEKGYGRRMTWCNCIIIHKVVVPEITEMNLKSDYMLYQEYYLVKRQARRPSNSSTKDQTELYRKMKSPKTNLFPIVFVWNVTYNRKYSMGLRLLSHTAAEQQNSISAVIVTWGRL